MKFTAAQIAGILNGTVDGDEGIEVSKLAKIEEGSKGSLTFLANPKYTEYIYTTKASAIIVKQDLELKQAISPALIRVTDPYSSFSKLLEEYQKLTQIEKSGIEQPSFQSITSQIEDGVYLGAFSYLGENVKIGKGTKIYPNCVIGDNVTIGENTILFAGVKVYADCKIGNHCKIHSGVVIGSEGFGYAPQPDGTFKAIPQTGNVIIHDHVDIGANTVVDCATMGSTIIKDGAKIDNLVQIAHNVEIGKNTAIASQAGISGSAKIGENVMIGGQAGITGHLTIADKVVIGPQSGVPKTIENQGIYTGTPIMDHREFLKSSIALRKLPELLRRVSQLEKKG